MGQAAADGRVEQGAERSGGGVGRLGGVPDGGGDPGRRRRVQPVAHRAGQVGVARRARLPDVGGDLGRRREAGGVLEQRPGRVGRGVAGQGGRPHRGGDEGGVGHVGGDALPHRVGRPTALGRRPDGAGDGRGVDDRRRDGRRSQGRGGETPGGGVSFDESGQERAGDRGGEGCGHELVQPGVLDRGRGRREEIGGRRAAGHDLVRLGFDGGQVGVAGQRAAGGRPDGGRGVGRGVAGPAAHGGVEVVGQESARTAGGVVAQPRLLPGVSRGGNERPGEVARSGDGGQVAVQDVGGDVAEVGQDGGFGRRLQVGDGRPAGDDLVRLGFDSRQRRVIGQGARGR